MALTNTPFFGLGSRGTVGGSLTSQKRGSATLLRQKPVPTDPYSLPQAYQRWLYQDYAYLWTQQSLATRQAYQSLGARHHLTGFQYWMKYNLATLPYTLAWWKLDEGGGAIAYDSSPNNRHGTIFGATPCTGAIGPAYLFDKLNDHISIPAWKLPDTFSIEAYFTLNSTTLTQCLLTWAGPAAVPIIGLYYATNAFRLGIHNDAANNVYWVGAWAPILNTLLHVVINQTAPSTKPTIFVNAVPLIVAGIPVGNPYHETLPCSIGRYGSVNTGYWGGIIDNIVVRNRTLDLNEIARHSERRYPA